MTSQLNVHSFRTARTFVCPCHHSFNIILLSKHTSVLPIARVISLYTLHAAAMSILDLSIFRFVSQGSKSPLRHWIPRCKEAWEVEVQFREFLTPEIRWRKVFGFMPRPINAQAAMSCVATENWATEWQFWVLLGKLWQQNSWHSVPKRDSRDSRVIVKAQNKEV